MITINPANIHPDYSKKLATFFNSQAKNINVWNAGQHYTFEDGTQFQFTSDVVKRQRKEGKGGYRYEFISDRLLGTGKFGEVYEIEGTLAVSSDEVQFKPLGLNNKTRAVKIQRHYAQNPIDVVFQEYSLSLEASHLGIKHPTIEGSTSYTVMKKLKGQELFTIIVEDLDGIHFLTLKQRAELTRALLNALKEQVTDKGIIHRDVKNENILVDLDSGLVSFFDFGLSVKVDALDGKSCGTAAYAPPEIFFKGKQTVKIDVFSLGRVLALIWRVDTASYTEDVRRCSQNSLHVNLNSLFSGLGNIDADNKEIIRSMLKGMLQADVDARFTIEQAIALFSQVTLAPITPELNFQSTRPTELLDKNTVFIQNDLVKIKIQAMQLSLPQNQVGLNSELKLKIDALARDLHSKIDKLSEIASQKRNQDLSTQIREAQQLIREHKSTFEHYNVGSILTNIGLDFMTITLANLDLNMEPLPASSENQFVFFKGTKTTPTNVLPEETDKAIEKPTNKTQ
ncbi:protein kinase (plasmid) [Legionella lytica]|uniref:Protein kinase n=1 Tax=Legionella lytica TaxID=96232 RepID=A0ABY4YDA9_9GAMM|nr:protein kinase [Legionella lytica]USQ15426.1 protein kinase [Legionella lytica]